MPPTPKAHNRPGPYDKESQGQEGNEGQEQSQPTEQEQIKAALEAAAPKKPVGQRHLDFRTLTPPVLAECLTMQEPKPQDTCIMAFHKFNLVRYCEMTGHHVNDFDLKKFGQGQMTVLTPFARMPFGVNAFHDEKTGKPKYTCLFSLYNPECQQDLDDYAAWVNGPYKDRMLKLIEEQLVKWGEKPNPNPIAQQAVLDNMWHSPIKASADPQYKDSFTCKIKSTDTDQPIVQVWNQKTQGTVSYNQIQHGDYGQSFVYFEGLTKVGGKFYPRVFTRAVIYTDPPNRQDMSGPQDDTYPLPEAATV